MSNLPPLLCLFCNQCNVASAKYCNECASPLHLQPCNHCRAIDNRTAIACYKCGTKFDVPAAPEAVSIPAAPDLAPAPTATRRAPSAASKRARGPGASKRVRRPAASKSAPASSAPEGVEAPAPLLESVPGPIPEDQIAKPSGGGSAIERAILSTSPAAVSAFRPGLRRDVPDTQDQTARVADWDATSSRPDAAPSAVDPHPMDETEAAENLEMFDPAQSPMEREPIQETVTPASVQGSELAHFAVKSQPIHQTAASESSQYPILVLSADEPRRVDERLESEWAVVASGTRRARRLALATLLLAATAFAGYYYYDRSAQQLAPVQSQWQPAPSTPDAAVAVGAAAATVAPQVEAASAAADATSQITTGAEKVEGVPSPAAPVVSEPRTDSGPVPANQSLDAPAAVARPVGTPQPAGAASSPRRPPPVDAGVGSRRDPTFRECTEAVAALGLCSPSK